MTTAFPCERCGCPHSWVEDTRRGEGVIRRKRKCPRCGAVFYTWEGRMRSEQNAPDGVADFREILFPDNSFRLVVFDPPHLIRAGETSWVAKKYGVLSDTWRQDICKGFSGNE